jgi:hypothetical protein
MAVSHTFTQESRIAAELCKAPLMKEVRLSILLRALREVYYDRSAQKKF